MTSRVAITIGFAAVLATACSKDEKGGAASDDAVVAAWKKEKLEVSALTDADPKPYSAQSCKAGTVSGVDVVLCQYDTGEDAKAAEEPALAGLQGVTGLAIAKGARLLVASDKRKADPSGRTLNLISGPFRK